jgi:hypothetical protein
MLYRCGHLAGFWDNVSAKSQIRPSRQRVYPPTQDKEAKLYAESYFVSLSRAACAHSLVTVK